MRHWIFSYCEVLFLLSILTDEMIFGPVTEHAGGEAGLYNIISSYYFCFSKAEDEVLATLTDKNRVGWPGNEANSILV